MRRTYTALAAFSLVAMTGCSMMKVGQYDHRLRAAWKNKAAPDFKLSALDGGSVRLSDLRGKPVVLAFWAYG